MKRALLLIGMLLAFDVEAEGFDTGNDLLRYCSKHVTNPFYNGLCSGYTIAIADVMVIDSVAGFRACFPATVTRGRLLEVSMQYLRAHPEQLHYTAVCLVAAALSEAFPCKK